MGFAPRDETTLQSVIGFCLPNLVRGSGCTRVVKSPADPNSGKRIVVTPLPSPEKLGKIQGVEILNLARRRILGERSESATAQLWLSLTLDRLDHPCRWVQARGDSDVYRSMSSDIFLSYDNYACNSLKGWIRYRGLVSLKRIEVIV